MNLELRVLHKAMAEPLGLWKLSRASMVGLCSDQIDSGYIREEAWPVSDLMVQAVEVRCGRGGRCSERLVGFILVNSTAYESFYFIEVICADPPGSGKLMMAQLERVAMDEGRSGIALSALPQVISYYRSLGFQNQVGCHAERLVITRFYNAYILPLYHAEKALADQQRRRPDFSFIPSTAEYQSFLVLLIDSRLAKDNECETPVECDGAGYLMFKCLQY